MGKCRVSITGVKWEFVDNRHRQSTNSITRCCRNSCPILEPVYHQRILDNKAVRSKCFKDIQDMAKQYSSTRIMAAPGGIGYLQYTTRYSGLCLSSTD